MDEFEEGCCEHPSYPWSWKQAAVAAVDLIQNVMVDAATFLGHINYQLAASCNHDIDVRDFRESVARDIESITEEE